MSATGRGRARNVDDVYLTPPVCAAVLTALIDLRHKPRTLEPSVGLGSFVASLWTIYGYVPEAVDVREEACRALRATMALEGMPETTIRRARFEDVTEPEAYGAIIGNPPYSDAQKHIEHAHYLLEDGGVLAFLLRLNFLGSQERAEFFRRFPPWRVYVLVERPDFTGDGGDATEYAFFVWRKGWEGDTVVRWVEWRDTRRLAEVRRIRALDWR